MSPITRNANLDTLRAAAITAVVLAHSAAMSPVRRPLALTLAWLGQFGVDLFFVLSGWLIGGLFWREYNRFGDVAWPRFFLRRALRTVPPYLVILPFAWYAVYHFSPARPPFDFGYLLFLQNYEDKIPFYAISWSLCVEEHFYLFLPALLLFTLARRISPHPVLAGLLLLSPLCRAFFETTLEIGDFNRSVLATHLRLDGLVLGFWFASLPIRHPALWSRVAQIVPRLFVPALLLLAVTPAIPGRLFYVAGFTLLALIFFVVLGTAVVRPAWTFPGHLAVHGIARISFSIYLTHSLAIHVARRLAPAAGAAVEWVYWPVVLGLILAAGYVFYLLVERPALAIRDRLLPARRSLVAPPA